MFLAYLLIRVLFVFAVTQFVSKWVLVNALVWQIHLLHLSYVKCIERCYVQYIQTPP